MIRLFAFHNSKTRIHSLNNFYVSVFILEHSKIFLPSPVGHSDTSGLYHPLEIYAPFSLHNERPQLALESFCSLKPDSLMHIEK